MANQKKPTGISASIRITSSGVHREVAEFPQSKNEIERLMAEAFCAGKPTLNPQIAHYGNLTNLTSQPENSLDFRITTAYGDKWLELAEFAPLALFHGRYENVPIEWDISEIRDLFLSLIKEKGNKGYGEGVILLIYKTHNSLYVPPPILRCVTKELADHPPPFEAIYFISAHSVEHSMTRQIWPEDLKNQGPTFHSGTAIIGIEQ
ncbi:hypothetical protein [Trabulsiella odontotermitis]|uniref:hypothetical protein n=1 Tax=Trabulsiella odontotermitis TaxID=379893 RepID=UPI0006BA3B9C|nr:hypothetical protein [Trabulsiella odontotermitis]